MKLFSKQKKSGWLAMCSLKNGTAIAHVLKQYPNKPLIKKAEIRKESLRDNQALNKLSADFELSSQPCTLVLAPSEYHLLQAEKPNVPPSELKQAVAWKLKDLIDCPIDQVTVDVIEIPTDQDNTSRQPYVYAAAAKNTVLGSYINGMIVEAGIDIQVIDIPELAQRNLAFFLEDEGRAMAMISINENDTLLTFTAEGELYYARHIEIDTGDIGTDDSEQKSNLFERLALEVQRSLDSFERQCSYVSISKLVIAPFNGREDFYDYLKPLLYIPVVRFDLDEVFNLDDSVDVGDQAMQAALLSVLGAALRQD